jgi:hypothetical protein
MAMRLKLRKGSIQDNLSLTLTRCFNEKGTGKISGGYGRKLNRVVAMIGNYERIALESFMKPVPEYHQITNDLFIWHGYNPECKTDCSSTAIRTPDGFVLIDPVRLEEQAIERMVGDDRVGACS